MYSLCTHFRLLVNVKLSQLNAHVDWVNPPRDVPSRLKDRCGWTREVTFMEHCQDLQPLPTVAIGNGKKRLDFTPKGFSGTCQSRQNSPQQVIGGNLHHLSIDVRILSYIIYIWHSSMMYQFKFYVEIDEYSEYPWILSTSSSHPSITGKLGQVVVVHQENEARVLPGNGGPLGGVDGCEIRVTRQVTIG